MPARKNQGVSRTADTTSSNHAKATAAVAEPVATATQTPKVKSPVPEDLSSRNSWVFELTGIKPAVFKIRNDAGENRALNEKTGRFEAIRYCSNEDSVWVSEQSKQMKKGFIIFSDGTLEVPFNETAKLEFLFRHPEYNKTFRLLDRERDAKADLERIDLEFSAMEKAKKAPFSELKLIALAKGYDSSSEAVCRRAMYDYARSNPEAFLDAFDNDSIRISAKLRMAMNQGVITSDGTHLRWSDNSQRFMTIPAGADPIAYAATILVDSTNDQNVATLNALSKKLGE